MSKKYYCVRQQGKKDCGVAALATVLMQYGFNASITEIKELAGTDEDGTNVYGLVKAANQLGFSAKGVKGDKEAFFSEFPLPCIAHVIVRKTLQHYVVIHEISKKKIVIADPSRGIVKLNPDKFFGYDGVRGIGRMSRYKWDGVLIMLAPDTI